MIKIDINKGESRIQARGNMITILSETAIALKGIYDSFDDDLAKAIFKKSIVENFDNLMDNVEKCKK